MTRLARCATGTFVAVVVWAAVPLASVAGEPPVVLNGDVFQFSDKEAIDVRTLVQLMSRFLDKSFLYNERDVMQKQVNLSSPITVRREEAIDVFNRILQINQLAIVDYGTYAQVVPSANAKFENIPTVTPEQALAMANSAEHIKVSIPLNFADPTAAASLLSAMVSAQDSTVRAVPETGVILATGPASSVAHVVQTVRQIDISSQRPRPVPYILRHANAADLTEQLRQVLAQIRPPRAGLTPIQVQPYERLNALIILALPAEHEEIAALMEQLDQPTLAAPPTLHVYSMKNREAVDVAKVLEAFFSAGSAQPGAPTTTVTPLLAGISSQAGPVSFRIVADEKSNSLVVVAPKEDYDQLLNILAQLDRRRPQVLVEAAIIEVSGTDLFSLGVDIMWLDDVHLTRSLYRSAFLLPAQTPSPTAPHGSPESPFAGMTPGITLGYTKKPNQFTALLRALARTDKIRILAQPLLLTTDAEEAEFKSVDERPVAERSVTSTTQEAITSFGQYVEAGVNLKVKPFIREAGHVHSQVFLDISDFTGEATENLPPPKVSRTLQAVVDVPDGRVVVIGGINRTRLSKQLQRVPLLSRIPIVGELFKNRTNEENTNTVYLFMAPHILDDEAFADLAGHTQDRLNALNQANRRPIPEARDMSVGPLEPGRNRNWIRDEKPKERTDRQLPE